MNLENIFKDLGKNLSFKKESDKDQGFLLSLYGSTRENELSATTMTQQEKKDFITSQFRLKESDYKKRFTNASFYIVKRKKQDIGRIVVDESDGFIHLVDIALVSKSRGAGFGSTIISKLILKAKREEKIFKLSVGVDNVKALKLYQALGLKIINQDGHYFTMQNQF